MNEHDINDLRELFCDGLTFETACNELDLESLQQIAEAHKLWDEWESE